jgi:hypothetical protein
VPRLGERVSFARIDDHLGVDRGVGERAVLRKV